MHVRQAMIGEQQTRPEFTVAVAMIGARRHYAVPVILERAGLLSHLYTDAYAGKGWLTLATAILRPWCRRGSFKKLAGRQCAVSADKTTAFHAFGIRYWWKLRRAGSPAGADAVFLWAGEQFNRLVQARLTAVDAVYGFNGASAGLFRHCRDRGIRCILDQAFVPRRAYERLLSEEQSLWPGWERDLISPRSAALSEQEAQEWATADRILVGSSYVHEALAANGAPARKCAVVPYGVETATYQPQPTRMYGQPLRVLFVGTVGLRKGVQYLLQAAAKLSKLVSVRVVGPLSCCPHRLAAHAPPNTQICTQVPRHEVRAHLDWADVFCLPSLCEGSAGVTNEALAAGLPVICTPNTGAVVRDGIEGYTVPVRDSEAIAEKLHGLAHDARLLKEMSQNARRRAQDYNWQRYGERLVAAVANAVGAD